MINTGNQPEKMPLCSTTYISGGEGGLYCSIVHNSIGFCHFTRNTCIFCRLLSSLSSRIRLSNAVQSLLWISEVARKSNMSNKAGFSFSRLTELLPSAKIVPGGIFSRCIQRLSGVCSETAFDMQRLLQVHTLRSSVR
jgi:hypothetical protein